METVLIDKKEYVIIEKKQFELLQLEAAKKIEPAKKMTLKKGKEYAYKLIDSWAKEK
jgi:hypothetical protein